MIKYLLGLLLFINGANPLQINFGEKTLDMSWRVTNDTVMGGVSDADAFLTDNSVVFSGYLSLENNGGFVSFRSRYDRYDLSAFSNVKIRYKSTGQRFGFSLEQYSRFWMPYFKIFLEDTKSEWVVVDVALEQFEEFRLGKTTGTLMKKVDLKETIRMGFIAMDKTPGPFEFEVDYIEFY